MQGVTAAITDFVRANLPPGRSQLVSCVRIQKGEQRPLSIKQYGKLIPSILLLCVISVVIKLSYVMYTGTQAVAKISSVLSAFRSI